MDGFRFAEVHKEIMDLKKAATKRENERKEMDDVVEQDRLVEIKGGSNPSRVTEAPDLVYVQTTDGLLDIRGNQKVNERSNLPMFKFAPRSMESVKWVTSRSTQTVCDINHR